MIRLFCVILFCYVCFAEEKMRFAAVIYRHGDRTPVDTYPTDPYRNESYWPVKFGQLTNLGKMQHYKLGKWLRNRYSDILSDGYDSAEMRIRSTDVDRTLMSAQANLAGMYPPKDKSIWNNNLLWQPIPVHTEPEKDDEVLAMKKKCTKYDKEYQKMIESKSYKERLQQYQNLMDYLTSYTGRKIKDYYDIMDIYNILYIESLYNLTLPKWTKSVYPYKMRNPACYSFSTSAATPILARLRAGPLVKDIMSKIKAAISRSDAEHEKLRVAIYSGHDFTIGTLLTALHMFDGNCPVYTATILIELIYDTEANSQFIRILYRNSTEIVEPHVLQIPYCGTRCPVERFNELYKNLITVNFDNECDNDLYMPIMGVSGTLLVVIVFGFIIKKSCQNRNQNQRGSLSAYATTKRAVFL